MILTVQGFEVYLEDCCFQGVLESQSFFKGPRSSFFRHSVLLGLRRTGTCLGAKLKVGARNIFVAYIIVIFVHGWLHFDNDDEASAEAYRCSTLPHPCKMDSWASS